MELLQVIHNDVKRFNENYGRDVKFAIETENDKEGFYHIKASIHLYDYNELSCSTHLYSKFDTNWRMSLNVYGFLCDQIIKKQNRALNKEKPIDL